MDKYSVKKTKDIGIYLKSLPNPDNVIVCRNHQPNCYSGICPNCMNKNK